MFILLLIAKGWPITSNYFDQKNWIVGWAAVYVILFFILYIWDLAGRDPASSVYFYDSVPGVLIIVIRVRVISCCSQ